MKEETFKEKGTCTGPLSTGPTFLELFKDVSFVQRRGQKNNCLPNQFGIFYCALLARQHTKKKGGDNPRGNVA